MVIIGKTVRVEIAPFPSLWFRVNSYTQGKLLRSGQVHSGSDYEGDEQEEHADYDGGEGDF